MRLFKRMKDPVRGIGKVVDASSPGAYVGPGSIRMVISADGVPPTPVEYAQMRSNTSHSDRWPRPDQQVPVTVDRADPKRFKIEWDELDTHDARTKRRDDAREEQILAEMRGKAQLGVDVRGGPGVDA